MQDARKTEMLEELMLADEGMEVEENLVGIDALIGLNAVYAVRRNDRHASGGEGELLL